MTSDRRVTFVTCPMCRGEPMIRVPWSDYRVGCFFCICAGYVRVKARSSQKAARAQ